MIGNSVVSIGDYAFYYCRMRQKVILPNTIKSIGYNAFNDAFSYPLLEIQAPVPPQNFRTSLSFSNINTLIVPKGCARIYEESLAGLSVKVIELNKVEVTIPPTSTLFDELLTLRVTPNRVSDLIIHGSLKGEDISWINTNMTSLINLDVSDTDLKAIPETSMKDNKTLTRIVLPNSLTAIYSRAFENCTVLAEVELPNTLEEIDSRAFRNCNIVKINFPEGLHTVGDRAFQNSYLIDFTLPSTIGYIGSNAFEGCCVRYLHLPKNITYLGELAFAYSKYVSKVSVEEGFNCANLNLFRGCRCLEYVSLPTSLTSIGDGMFSNCIELKSVYVEEDDCKHNTVDLSDCPNLTSIGDNAFELCERIETINLPETLATIGDGAFRNCKNVNNISSPAVVAPKINTNGFPFEGINNDRCLLSIPTKSFRDYFQSMYWAGFMTFETKGEIEIETEDEDGLSFDDCNLYYKEGYFSNSPISAMKKSRGVQIKKETLPGKTRPGFSLFINDLGIAQIEIIPYLGAWVKSVFYDGIDVTSQLKNNIFVTPVVAANDLKKLKVVFYKNVSSGVEFNNDISAIKVLVTNGVIDIVGVKNARVNVFNLSGQCVYSGMETSIPLTKGIYIVRVAGTVHKVIL